MTENKTRHTNLGPIPEEMTKLKQWVIAEWIGDGKARSPIDPATLTNAAVNNPSTWGTYAEACAALSDRFPHLGFVLTKGDPYVGIDLDDCYDPETNDLSQKAMDVAASVDSYTETSPRGRGIHIIARSSQGPAYKTSGLEIYYSGRYFRMTGDHYPGTPLEINDRTLAVRALYPYLTPPRGLGENGEGEAEADLRDDLPDTLYPYPEKEMILITGERNNRLLSFAGALRRQGLGLKQLTAHLMRLNEDLCRPSLAQREVEALAISACRYKPTQLVKPLAALMAEKFAKGKRIEEKAEEMALAGWIVDSRLKLKSCTHNAIGKLASFGLSFDEFQATILLDGRLFTDIDLLRCVAKLERSTRIVWHENHVRGACSVVAAESAFDSLQGYLGGLAWDGVERLSVALCSIWGALDTPLNAAIGRAFFIQAAARGMMPGCMAHGVLMLMGAQGIGKSRSAQALCPYDEWFSSSTGYDLEDKDAALALQGKWIVEFPELASFSKSDLNAAKSFISRNADHFRKPYGVQAASYPRRSVFITTSNYLSPLTDETGARRWWPVECGRIDLGYIESNRDQLWAEAAAAVKAGENWIVPGMFASELNAISDRAYDEDDWTTKVLVAAGVQGEGGFTTVDIMESLLVPIAQQTRGLQMRIGKILLRSGKKRIRVREGDGLRWKYVESNRG